MTLPDLLPVADPQGFLMGVFIRDQAQAGHLRKGHRREVVAAGRVITLPGSDHLPAPGLAVGCLSLPKHLPSDCLARARCVPEPPGCYCQRFCEQGVQALARPLLSPGLSERQGEGKAQSFSRRSNVVRAPGLWLARWFTKVTDTVVEKTCCGCQRAEIRLPGRLRAALGARAKGPNPSQIAK